MYNDVDFKFILRTELLIYECFRSPEHTCTTETDIYVYITVFNAFTCKILSLMHPSKLIKDKKIIKEPDNGK